MPTLRRKARIVAVQALYEIDVAGHDPETTLDRIVADAKLTDESAVFARDLVHTVLQRRDEIDGLIASAAPAWPVTQLSPIDRTVLRVAIREMLDNNGTPVRAVINEAVELAKNFGSDSSARFVNGVLGTLSGQQPG